MKKIAFGLYNQITHRSQQYQTHIRAITDFSLNQFVKNYNISNKDNQQLYVGKDISSLINSCNDSNADYAFIVSYGFRSCFSDLIIKMVSYAEENNYSVLAHILQDNPEKDGFYSLHHQCLLINLTHWRLAGKPLFGHNEIHKIELPEVLRDPNNFHDNYTPGWIKSSGNIKHHDGSLKEGWNLISSFLTSGYTIGNFPTEIRNIKEHLYPDFGTELEQRLSGSNVVLKEPNQKRYVDTMSFSNFQDGVYVFNTDPMITNNIVYNKNTLLGTSYCVASGFKPLQLLNQCTWNSSTRIVYIDYSTNALKFRQWLVENWDGKDYINTVEFYKKSVEPNFRPIWFMGKDYQDQWNYTIDIFGGEESWLNIWSMYRELEHRYLKIDLFNSYQELIGDMKSQNHTNNLIWFSNSFYTEASLMNFQPEKLKSMYDTFIQEIKNYNSSIQICGTDTNGESNWIHYGEIK